MYTNAIGFGAHLRPAHVSGSVFWGVERRSASPAGVLAPAVAVPGSAVLAPV